MASLVTCPCRNVCLHLERAPVPQEIPFWLAENFKLPKGVGKGILVPAPGVTKQVPILCGEKEVEKDGQTWNCLMCLNCETFIYAEKATGGTPLYVNMVLQPKSERETQSHRVLSSLYSPVWKIILKDEDDCANSVIDSPDPSDAIRHEIFMDLQRQMKEFLEEEEAAMKARIREYEQKQLEELRELKTRSFRDRKVLWHRIDEELSKEGKKEHIVIETGTNVQSEELGDTEELEIDEEILSNEKEQKKKGSIWKNSRIKVDKTSSSDWLFQFDDEEYRSSPSRVENDLSGDDFDEIDDSNSIEYDDLDDYRPTEFQMAASLPVTIPSNLLPRNPPKRAKSPPSRKLDRKPFENQSSFDIPEAKSNADQEILSKSFAIPKSRNRVRGWM